MVWPQRYWGGDIVEGDDIIADMGENGEIVFHKGSSPKELAGL